MNGQVINESTRELWVVENDRASEQPVAHKLAPNRQSPGDIDADGFRAVDSSVSVDGHRSWVKINDLSTATVRDRGANLTSNCIACRNVGEGEFGTVTFRHTSGWGEPIT